MTTFLRQTEDSTCFLVVSALLWEKEIYELIYFMNWQNKIPDPSCVTHDNKLPVRWDPTELPEQHVSETQMMKVDFTEDEHKLNERREIWYLFN